MNFGLGNDDIGLCISQVGDIAFGEIPGLNAIDCHVGHVVTVEHAVLIRNPGKLNICYE